MFSLFAATFLPLPLFVDVFHATRHYFADTPLARPRRAQRCAMPTRC